MNAKIVILVAVFVCQASAGPFDLFVGVPKLFGTGLKQFQDVMDKGQVYGQQIQGMVKQQINDNIKFTQDMVGALSELFSAKINGDMVAGEKFAAQLESMMADGQKFAQGLVAQMQGRFEAAVKDNEKMINDVQNYFTQQFEDAQSKGKEYFDSFGKQMEAEIENMKNQGKTVSKDLENQVAQKQEMLAKISAQYQQNLLNAYEQGIKMMKAGQKALADGMKMMVQQAEEAVKSFQKVNDNMNAQIVVSVKA